MNRVSPILRTVAALAVLLSACSDSNNTDGDAGSDASTNAEPLWVATGWTVSGGEYFGFLAPVSDLLSGTIDLANVVDLGTDNSFGTDENGNVFVGRADSPVIQRWSLDDAGVLQMTGSVNFSSLGITSTMGGNRNVIQIISETRAYYFDNQGFRVVVFDPTAMTITDNFSISQISDGVADASLNFVVREGDRFFVSTRLWDEAEETIKELRVAIVSATSNNVTYATDTRCGDMAFSAKDEDGNVYFGSHHALAVYYSSLPDPAPKPCMLRILQGQSTFDATYHVNMNTLVDGFGAGLFQGPNGTAFIAKYQGENPDPSTAFNAPVWRLYTVELGNEASTLTEVTAVGLTTRYVSTFDTLIDGNVVPFLVTDSETGSVYTSLANPGSPTAGLSVTGAFFGRAARLR
jgi:hypothetical protein